MDGILSVYGGVLRQNTLFKGFDDEKLLSALKFFDAVRAEYKKGEYLHNAGHPLPRFGFVLQGLVQACSDDINGNRMIMANVTPGGTFGEALCFLHIPEAPVHIYAPENTVMLWLSPARVAAATDLPFELELKNRFTAMLAERTLAMNSRIQILSKLTLREKLIALFSEFSHKAGSNFTVPFDRNDMAVYLGTNRSALSRELSRMKKEGIIDYYKNSFRIL